jgi:zinc transporter ZupT
MTLGLETLLHSNSTVTHAPHYTKVSTRPVMFTSSSTRLLLLAIALGVVTANQGYKNGFDRHVVRPAAVVYYKHHDQTRLLETNETDHSEGCRCNGTVIHCSDEAEEAHCSCTADGVLACEEENEHGCHCDGSAIHCDDEAEEAHCSCSADGLLACEEEEEESQVDESKPWSEVIISSLLVNLVTLIGVFVLTGTYLRNVFCPKFLSSESSHLIWTRNIIPMFACGALLATAVFLILPEALGLIQADFLGGDGHEGHGHRTLQDGEHDGETQATWRFGTAIIGGFLIPVVTQIFFPHSEDVIDDAMQQETADTTSDKMSARNPESAGDFTEHASKLETESETKDAVRVPESDPNDDVAVVNDNVPVVSSVKPKVLNLPLLASIFLGDFFHNFTDGVFIGTAWLLCSRDLVYTIIAATVFHELAQEISDYFLMVHLCGLTPVAALALNFVCGLSVMLGGIIVLSVELTSSAVGVILCIGSGVYFHLAVGECLPTARSAHRCKKDKLYGLLAFTCGAVPIGLVLLNHQHC